jgi:sulfate transport system ATP-binding protein
VIVTHDQEEAMEVADRIVVMNEGRIEQIGTPVDIYDNPASPFVMNFVGEVNVIHDQLDSESETRLFVRPHDLELLDGPEEDSLPATICRLTAFGRDFQVELELDNGQRIHAQLNREQVSNQLDKLTPGARKHINLRSGRRF